MPLLIAFLILLALLLRVDFIFYVVYVIIGIYSFSYFYTPRVLRQLHLNRDFHSRNFIGESQSISISLINSGRLPIPWLEMRELIPLELRTKSELKQVISLGGRDRKEVSYSIRGMKRGYYKIGPLQVTAGDFFGFREVNLEFPADYVTIYPQVLSIAEMQLPSRLPFGTLASSQRLYQDPARPIGIRDYEFGDSLRHMNWKSSARAGRMLVKTYEPAISLETMILLNLNASDYQGRYRRDTIEWAIVVAASLGAHLIGQRQSIGFATNGVDPLLQDVTNGYSSLIFEDTSGRLLFQSESNGNSAGAQQNKNQHRLMPATIKTNSGRDQLMKVLELLARLESAETMTFAQWLTTATLRLSWGVTIIAISPSADDEILHSLHRLFQAGLNPILMIIDPYVNFRQISERAHVFGLYAFHARNLSKLTGWAKSE